MATLIRPEISVKNKYWIDKNRHYELKHFCLQYLTWRKLYASLDGLDSVSSILERYPSSNTPTDKTSLRAIEKAYYSKRIKMIEKAARDADDYLYPYILKAVTEGLSYTHLKSKLNIPCGRDMYYDRYRRFFWLLNESRE